MESLVPHSAGKEKDHQGKKLDLTWVKGHHKEKLDLTTYLVGHPPKQSQSDGSLDVIFTINRKSYAGNYLQEDHYYDSVATPHTVQAPHQWSQHVHTVQAPTSGPSMYTHSTYKHLPVVLACTHTVQAPTSGPSMHTHSTGTHQWS